MPAVELGSGWEATCRGAIRGALDALQADDPLNCTDVEIAADYAHSLDQDATFTVGVGVAIQAITLNLGRTGDKHEVNSGNLHLAASYTRKEPVPAVPALPAPEKPASG